MIIDDEQTAVAKIVLETLNPFVGRVINDETKAEMHDAICQRFTDQTNLDLKVEQIDGGGNLKVTLPSGQYTFIEDSAD